MYVLRRLLAATPVDEDPVALLRSAARDHIPLDPSTASKERSEPFSAVSIAASHVPESKDRPTIGSVLDELEHEQWYKDQIVDRRTFDEKHGQIGSLIHLESVGDWSNYHFGLLRDVESVVVGDDSSSIA
jgi:DEAD/DEAH box helicase domain-containing protein